MPYQLVIVCIECKLNANEKSIARERKRKRKNIVKRRVGARTTAGLISGASATATAVFKPQLFKLQPFKVVISIIGY